MYYTCRFCRENFVYKGLERAKCPGCGGVVSGAEPDDPCWQNPYDCKTRHSKTGSRYMPESAFDVAREEHFLLEDLVCRCLNCGEVVDREYHEAYRTCNFCNGSEVTVLRPYQPSGLVQAPHVSPARQRRPPVPLAALQEHSAENLNVPRAITVGFTAPFAPSMEPETRPPQWGMPHYDENSK